MISDESKQLYQASMLAAARTKDDLDESFAGIIQVDLSEDEPTEGKSESMPVPLETDLEKELVEHIKKRAEQLEKLFEEDEVVA